MSSLLWEAAIQQEQQDDAQSNEQASSLTQLSDPNQTHESHLPMALPGEPDNLPPPPSDEGMKDEPGLAKIEEALNLPPPMPMDEEEKKDEKNIDTNQSDDDDNKRTSKSKSSTSARSLNGQYYDRKKSGHRQIMATVSSYLKEAVIGDSDGDYTECMIVFLNEFLNRRENLEIRERIAEFSVKPVIQSIRKAYDAAMDRDKPQMASLVCGHFTRSELSRLGFPISSHSFSAANRHIATRGVGVKVAPPQLPPKRKPLSKQQREELYAFLEANSFRSEKHKVRVPKPNRPPGSKETESMACRQLNTTRAELRRKWKSDPNHAQMAQSTFNREIQRFRVFKYHSPPGKGGRDMGEMEQPPQQQQQVPMQMQHPQQHHVQQPQYQNMGNLQQLQQQQQHNHPLFNQFQVPQLPPHPSMQQNPQHPGQQQNPGMHQPHPGHPNILLGGMNLGGQMAGPMQGQMSGQMGQVPTLSQTMQF